MTTSHTLTGSLADIIGNGGVPTSATLDTNLGDISLVDLDNNSVRLPGRAPIELDANLAFSLSLIATDSTGTNVPDGSLRYIVRVSYRDGQGACRTWNSGYFELTADTDLSAVAGTDVAVSVDPAPAPATIDSATAANVAADATATRIALDSRYSRTVDASSWPVYAYGNSYAVQVAGWFTLGRHYLELSADALGAGALTSYAVGGRRILDVCSTLINGANLPGTTGALAAGKWISTTARNGLVVLDSIVNDAAHYPTMITPAPAVITSANTRYVDGIKAMYRTALALMSSESRIEDSAGAISGAWTQAASGNASGGNISYTSAVGAHMTFTVTPPQSGPLAGKVFLLTYALDPSIGNTCATINVSVDGGASVPFTMTPWEQYIGHAGTACWQQPVVIPVTVPADGAAHTVRMTHAGTAGHFMYADDCIVPSSSPNPIAVMGGEIVPNVSVFDAAGVNAYRYNTPLIAAAVRAVVAEFANAYYVPSTLTSGGLYSGDGLHPNDRGMEQRAADLVAATQQIKARLDSRALALLPDGAFGVV